MDRLDCVIVGHNQFDLDRELGHREMLTEASGAYKNILHKTIPFRGHRLSYMELLNVCLTEASGRAWDLNIFDLPSLGVCYLRSFLVRRGFRVEAVNAFNKGRDRLIELLRQQPRAVALTTTFYFDPRPPAEIIELVRAHSPQTRVILGGPFVADICRENVAIQDGVLDMVAADLYVNDSQGEDTLARLLHQLRNGMDLDAVPNLVYPKRLLGTPSPSGGGGRRALPLLADGPVDVQSSYVRTPREPETNGLDDNAVDWSLFSPEFLGPAVQVRTARSCPYSCAFCNYPVAAGKHTLASIETVEGELRKLRNTGVRHLMFIDDTFNVPITRFKKLLRMLIANDFGFNWFSFLRCAEVDDEAFELMEQSGCKGVFLGIESAHQTVLNNMNKHATVDKYVRGIGKLHEHHIASFAAFIIGFPGETRETVQANIDFLEQTRPTFFQAELYFHEKKLPIEKQADRFGIRGSDYSWRHNTMDWAEAVAMIDHMYTTVKGSLVFPAHMFSFWAMPYLLANGLTMDQLQRYLRLCHELRLAADYGIGPAAGPGGEEAVFRAMVGLAGGIAAPRPDERAGAVAVA